MSFDKREDSGIIEKNGYDLYDIPLVTYGALGKLAERLTLELGFPVDRVSALGWLVKHTASVVPTLTLNVTRMDDEVKRLMLEGKKIHAIKLVRTVTDLGLKDAKEYVERFADWYPLGFPLVLGRPSRTQISECAHQDVDRRPGLSIHPDELEHNHA